MNDEPPEHRRLDPQRRIYGGSPLLPCGPTYPETRDPKDTASADAGALGTGPK